MIKYSLYQVKTKVQMHARFLILKIYTGIVYDLIDAVKQDVMKYVSYLKDKTGRENVEVKLRKEASVKRGMYGIQLSYQRILVKDKNFN